MEGDARSFRIGPCVGRGGFGEVYRAWMTTAGGLQTEVALKILRPDPLRRADASARFRDEGRMLSRLQHPAVVRAFDWADLGDGHMALVTEFVDGADLHACAAIGIGERPLLEVIGAVASALHAAYHGADPDGRPLEVIHRDIKPTNLRIGRHGQVRLLDFGIARFGSDERESRTESDLVVGSVPYMAPERFSERVSSPAADVYGLGCCLYEGLVGTAFHRETRLRDLSAMALNASASAEHLASRLEQLPATVHPETRALLERCLAHDPARRPTADEVARICEGLAGEVRGPTLRRWCADVAFPEDASFAATWTGRRVTEGEDAGEQDEADRGRPKVVHQAGATVDPDLLDAGPPPALSTTPLEVAALPLAPRPARGGRGARWAVGALGAMGCALVVLSVAGALGTLMIAVVGSGW
ncbi:MAG: serine/threonine protein kinase [Myxococcales bacterium]|nr:serine/threonine protein kinase [Myxococcales bacterium]